MLKWKYWKTPEIRMNVIGNMEGLHLRVVRRALLQRPHHPVVNRGCRTFQKSTSEEVVLCRIQETNFTRNKHGKEVLCYCKWVCLQTNTKLIDLLTALYDPTKQLWTTFSGWSRRSSCKQKAHFISLNNPLPVFCILLSIVPVDDTINFRKGTSMPVVAQTVKRTLISALKCGIEVKNRSSVHVALVRNEQSGSHKQLQPDSEIGNEITTELTTDHAYDAHDSVILYYMDSVSMTLEPYVIYILNSSCMVAICYDEGT